MLHLVPKKLTEKEVKILKELQDTINSKTTFLDKVQAAKDLWGAQHSSKEKNASFEVIYEC